MFNMMQLTFESHFLFLARMAGSDLVLLAPPEEDADAADEAEEAEVDRSEWEWPWP